MPSLTQYEREAFRMPLRMMAKRACDQLQELEIPDALRELARRSVCRDTVIEDHNRSRTVADELIELAEVVERNSLRARTR
jgi:hypothetical protein